MNTCPRCTSSELRLETEGRENDRTLWRVHHCAGCSFTWRDSEPAVTIDANERDPWFQVDPSKDDEFPYNIPPAR